MQRELFACRAASIGRLIRTAFLEKINTNIIGKFTDGMTDLLTGQQYKEVDNGLEHGIAQIVDAIIRKENEITNYNNNIRNCDNQIQAMRREIRRIEAAEEAARLAAIRRAEQERLEAEAAAAEAAAKSIK